MDMDAKQWKPCASEIIPSLLNFDQSLTEAIIYQYSFISPASVNAIIKTSIHHTITRAYCLCYGWKKFEYTEIN